MSRAVLLAFFSVSILSKCANPMAPQGGPRDSLPPVVVNMTPVYGATNFTAKRIFIEFDEYVQLKDFQKEFFTSPAIGKKPTAVTKGRGIQIDITDTLAPNTTYALNFGSSISDLNESNPSHSFNYVFSTGDRVDSMVMSGYTVDANTKDSLSKTFIFFYDAGKDSYLEYDSTVFNFAPDVIARAENNGIFIAENLKPIAYRVYAVDDRNGNLQYEPGMDGIAFLDSVFNPATMPAFDVWYDTIRKYVTADPQLYFRVFKDEQSKRQYLAGQSRPMQRKIVLNFGAHYPHIDSLIFDSIPDSGVIMEYLKPTRDSIAYWFSIPEESIPDTIVGSISYIRHDSIGNLVPETKEFRLGWRKPALSRQQERELERQAEARQEAVRLGQVPEKEPNPFKFKLDLPNPFNPETDISMSFDYPLARMDSAEIMLLRRREEQSFRVRTRVEQDTANIRLWYLKAPLAMGQDYTLEIPPGALVNIAGEMNDSIKMDFKVMDTVDFATLSFNVAGKTPESEYLLELLDQSGANVLNKIEHARTGLHIFRFVPAGTVRLRVTEDMNGNGKWDTGNLVERRQPEKVGMFMLDDGSTEIPTKTGWATSYDLDMNLLFAPATMENIMEQIRKQDEIMIRKYLENKAKKAAQGAGRTTNQGSSMPFNPVGGFNMGR